MSSEIATRRAAADVGDGGSVLLTVVVATTQPWPEIEMCLDSLHDQAREVGVELLVVDGHGEGLPADVLGKYPQVTRIALPGRSVFQMRAEGMARSRGAVVAVTEDHCRVAAEWLRSEGPACRARLRPGVPRRRG